MHRHFRAEFLDKFAQRLYDLQHYSQADMKNHLILTFLTIASLTIARTTLAQGSVSFGGAYAIITSNTVTGATAKIANGQCACSLYASFTTNALLAATAPVLTVINSQFGMFPSGGIVGLPSGALFQVKCWTPMIAQSYEDFIVLNQPGSAAGVSDVGEITYGAPGSTFFLFGNFVGAVKFPILLTPVPIPIIERPTLTVMPPTPAGNWITLSWTNAATGFSLETSSDLPGGTEWKPYEGTVLQSGGRFTTQVTVSNKASLFRLRRP